MNANTEKLARVSGMHCASCAARISKVLSGIPGISSVQINSVSETARVSFDPNSIDLADMNRALQPLGYGLDFSLEENGNVSVSPSSRNVDYGGDATEHSGDSEQDKALFSGIVSAFVFLIMVWDMLARVFYSVPKIPFPMDLERSIFFVLASAVLLVSGGPFYRAVVRFARTGAANMDTLVGIGTLVAYVSGAVLFLFPSAWSLLRLPDISFFDVTIVVIGFVAVGKYFESRSKRRTGEAIRKLLRLQAKKATVVRDGLEMEISASDVVVGDAVLVRPGGSIPVDGDIFEGMASVDESAMTGEAIPVERGSGDTVLGGTTVLSGSIRLSATRVGSETAIARIVKAVEEAELTKAPVEALVDRISAVFVPIALGIAVLSFGLWMGIGGYVLGFSEVFPLAILSFIGVLVIACPCALGLATPAAIVVGMGRGALMGILFKNAESLQKLASVDTIVFDKTGTITEGKPVVLRILALDPSIRIEKIAQYAASVEALSEHPLAKAVVAHAHSIKVPLVPVSKFSSEGGVGVSGTVENQEIVIRKPFKIEVKGVVAECIERGETAALLLINGRVAGAVSFGDSLKSGIAETMRSLRSMGIRSVLLSGDHEKAVLAVAQSVGIEHAIGGMLPEEKASVIRSIQEGTFEWPGRDMPRGRASGERTVAMIGDGVNDAPALAVADVGMALSTGTDIAIESADATLLKGDIGKVLVSLRLARATLATVKQNLAWAFAYNAFGIPIAAGVLYPVFGITLNPAFAGLLMALSSVSVLGNSLRLQLKKL